MGLSSSLYIFSKVSDFVVSCGVVNYLDDFCPLADNYTEAVEQQNIFLSYITQTRLSYKLQEADLTYYRHQVSRNSE